MITENLSTLKIHKLTQAQYDRELAAGNIDENSLYLTPADGSNADTLDGKHANEFASASDVAELEAIVMAIKDEYNLLNAEEVSF